MRFILSVLFLTSSISYLQAQSLKDYVLPAKPVNTVLFSVPQSSMTRSKSYIDNDSVVIIMDSVFVQGSYSDGITYFVKFVGNEAHLIEAREQFNKSFNPNIVKYDPPLVLLKLPAPNGTEKWTTYDSIKEITTNYTASWEEIKRPDGIKKMLRVEKSVNYTTVKEVEYYVTGIGLFNAEILVGSSKMQKLKLEGTKKVKGVSK